jgi:hypothetical protein
VPAGGAAAVSITADTSVREVDGLFGGHLTATGADVHIVTPSDAGVHWQNSVLEFLPDDGLFYAAIGHQPVACEAPRTYRETWNQAAYGPALPEQGLGVQAAGPKA